MALIQSQYIAPKDIEKTSKGREGGGKMGKIVGGVAGGVIGGMAAGAGSGGAATAQGAMLGTAAGAGLGGMVGEMIDPGRQGSTAIERRMQTAAPQMLQSQRSEQLKQSILALHQAPPAIQQEYGKPLVTAYIQSVAQGGGQV